MANLFTNDNFEMTKEMKSALGISLFLHMGVAIVAVAGLPFLSVDKPLLNQPVPIEILDISDITTTNKAPNEIKLKKPKPEEAPKVEKKIEAPPKVDIKEPPKIKPIKKPDVVEEAKAEPEKAPPVPVAEKPKPPEPKKEKAKEPEVNQEEEFLSVLKNLQDAEAPSDGEENKDTKVQPEPSPLAKFSEKLSASEIDAIAAALNNQFRGCWNLMAGARNAEDIIVKINLVLRPDRSVQSARIVDQWRYNQDSFYRAAADEAMRAVRHPNCEVLDLPADKYDLWKNLTFNFNPSAQL